MIYFKLVSGFRFIRLIRFFFFLSFVDKWSQWTIPFFNYSVEIWSVQGESWIYAMSMTNQNDSVARFWCGRFQWVYSTINRLILLYSKFVANPILFVWVTHFVIAFLKGLRCFLTFYFLIVCGFIFTLILTSWFFFFYFFGQMFGNLLKQNINDNKINFFFVLDPDVRQ